MLLSHIFRNCDPEWNSCLNFNPAHTSDRSDSCFLPRIPFSFRELRSRLERGGGIAWIALLSIPSADNYLGILLNLRHLSCHIRKWEDHRCKSTNSFNTYFYKRELRVNSTDTLPSISHRTKTRCNISECYFPCGDRCAYHTITTWSLGRASLVSFGFPSRRDTVKTVLGIEHWTRK